MVLWPGEHVPPPSLLSRTHPSDNLCTFSDFSHHFLSMLDLYPLYAAPAAFV